MKVGFSFAPLSRLIILINPAQIKNRIDENRVGILTSLSILNNKNHSLFRLKLYIANCMMIFITAKDKAPKLRNFVIKPGCQRNFTFAKTC